LLHDGRRAATDLHDLDDDDDDDLARYYASSWLDTCCTTLNLLEETLNLNDVVSEDETT
jgi:hypothetical protein